jgi:hypothetical protein
MKQIKLISESVKSDPVLDDRCVSVVIAGDSTILGL